MSSKDSWLVEAAPNILTAAGIIFILIDGPLPFGDVIGVSLIAYGSALRTSYKLADAVVWVEARLENTNDSTPVTEVVLPELGISPQRTESLLPSRHSPRNPTRWCNRHRRVDTCYKY